MSVKNDNRVHRREVSTQDTKGTLTLSDGLVKQVHTLHTMVEKNTEWSGILVYEVLKGDVDDPSEFELFAHEVIPMDVGSSGYTEYSFDANDDYSFERIADYLEKGYKLGHIHTHHSMGTFFSGTDMSELHDNAPNHNFYLSLIVDYKNHGDWCAKVAISGEEVTTGTVKTTGFYKREGIVEKITRWTGHSGAKEVALMEDYGKDEDFSNEEDVEIVKPMLYVVDMDIELDIKASEWEDRVVSLNEKRTKPLAFGKISNVSNSYFPTDWKTKHAPKAPAKPQPTSYDLFDNDLIDPDFIIPANTISHKDMLFSPEECLPLLKTVLNNGVPTDEHLMVFMEHLEKALMDPKDEALWVDAIQDYLEVAAEAHFNVELDGDDMNCIALSIMDVLEPYRLTHIVYDTIQDVLEPFLLPIFFVNEDETTRLTGINTL